MPTEPSDHPLHLRREHEVVKKALRRHRRAAPPLLHTDHRKTKPMNDKLAETVVRLDRLCAGILAEAKVTAAALRAAMATYVDQMAGGNGDAAAPTDFPFEDVLFGVNVEMEHTSDVRKALEIALDHLAERPDYYKKLDKAGLVDEAVDRYGECLDDDEPFALMPGAPGVWTAEFSSQDVAGLARGRIAGNLRAAGFEGPDHCVRHPKGDRVESDVTGGQLTVIEYPPGCAATHIRSTHFRGL